MPASLLTHEAFIDHWSEAEASERATSQYQIRATEQAFDAAEEFIATLWRQNGGGRVSMALSSWRQRACQSGLLP